MDGTSELLATCFVETRGTFGWSVGVLWHVVLCLRSVMTSLKGRPQQCIASHERRWCLNARAVSNFSPQTHALLEEYNISINLFSIDASQFTWYMVAQEYTKMWVCVWCSSLVRFRFFAIRFVIRTPWLISSIPPYSAQFWMPYPLVNESSTHTSCLGY